MNKTVIGIFTDRPSVEEAISHFEEDGYNPKDISIVMKNKGVQKSIANNTGANVAGGALSGATTGAVVGGIAGILAGTVMPVLGGFLIGGPIGAALGLTGAAATTVSGAATGAVAGGLIGALVGLGVPEKDAEIYQEQLNEGAILLLVPVPDSRVDEAKAIMTEYNAQNIRVIVNNEEYQQHFHGHDSDENLHETHQHSHRGIAAA